MAAIQAAIFLRIGNCIVLLRLPFYLLCQTAAQKYAQKIIFENVYDQIARLLAVKAIDTTMNEISTEHSKKIGTEFINNKKHAHPVVRRHFVT